MGKRWVIRAWVRSFETTFALEDEVKRQLKNAPRITVISNDGPFTVKAARESILLLNDLQWEAQARILTGQFTDPIDFEVIEQETGEVLYETDGPVSQTAQGVSHAHP